MRIDFCFARLVCAILSLVATAVTPANAQWDNNGYWTGGGAEPEERRERRERVRQPSRSYDFDTGPSRDRVHGVADVAYFYSALEEGGQWINHPRYGDVWQPYVSEDWRPYTIGRWAYSDDYGWTWISDEPFGWAVYHYGRWAFDREMGWMWVPGTEWAPAWVAWRQGEEAIGWAPLPPEARLRDGQIESGGLFESDRYVETWVFVRPRYFTRPEMRRYVRSPNWNGDLVHKTAPKLGFERRAKHIRNRGLAPEEVEKLANKPVPRIRVAPVDEPGLKKPGRFDQWRERSLKQVKIYRPDQKRTEEAVRKYQAKSGRTETLYRTTRTPAKAPPAGTYPGGRPSVAAARPPAFDAPPAAAARPSKTEPAAPVETAKTPPDEAISEKPEKPAGVQPVKTWSGVDKSAPPAREARERGRAAVAGPSTSAESTGAAAPPGKRRWDASGPSGAPSVNGENSAQGED